MAAVRGAVELAGDVALEAAADFAGGFAFGAAAGDVGDGGRVAAHPGGGDHVDRGVECPVAASVEPVAGGLAAGGFQGLVPARRAKAASWRQRPGLENDTMAWAAVTGPMPGGLVSPGASWA
jgi:hypothetical protein